MPKHRTNPIIYDDVYQIHISKLKEWGYLVPGQIMKGVIKWSTRGEVTASISINVNMDFNKPFIELNFNYNDEPRKYVLYFTSSKSNLNKGEVLYFICPITKKKCRKLYLVNGIFAHREAFKGCMYETQTKSKKTREIIKFMDYSFKIDDLYSQIYKKGLKKEYSGKPTRRYLKLLRKIDKIENQKIGFSLF